MTAGCRFAEPDVEQGIHANVFFLPVCGVLALAVFGIMAGNVAAFVVIVERFF